MSESMIIRVCDLKVGDIFEMYGHEYQVTQIKDKQIFYMIFILHWTGRYYKDSREQAMGEKSKQFVNLIKSKPCSGEAKKQNRRKQ